MSPETPPTGKSSIDPPQPDRSSAITSHPPRARDGRSGVCILVFGVSGVGKTSACQAFVNRHPAFLYFRASALLSEALSATPEELRTGSAGQIEANQALLGQQFSLRRSAVRERPVLVDVHAIIDNDEAFVRVPIETIDSLQPDGLVLLEAPAVLVVERRRTDERPRPVRSIQQITEELTAERDAVLDFAGALDLPLEVAQVNDGFALEAAIVPLLGRITRPERRRR